MVQQHKLPTHHWEHYSHYQNNYNLLENKFKRKFKICINNYKRRSQKSINSNKVEDPTNQILKKQIKLYNNMKRQMKF